MRIKLFFSIILILFFYSCQSKYTKNKIILHAENLLTTNPDSSYILLKSIGEPDNLSSVDYAAWCLHMAHAQYKLFKEDDKMDSLVNNAITYYEKTKDSKYLGISWYLKGCLHRLKNKNSQALLAFKNAEKNLLKTKENDIKGLMYFNIGSIYVDDEMYNYSLSCFRKSLECFKLSVNPKYQAYSYREIANMYVYLGFPTDSILKNMDLAIDLSLKQKDSINYYDALARKGKFLYDKNYDLAKENILKAYNYFPSQRPFFGAYLAYIYSNINKHDSAKYYLDISLKDRSRPRYKLIGYLAAELVALNEKDYKKAYYYSNKCYIHRDSIFRQSIKSQIYRIDKEFNLNLKEKENAELQLVNRNNQIIISLLVIAVLIIAVLSLLIINRIRLVAVRNEAERKHLELERENIKNVNAQKQEIILLKLNQNIANTLKFNELKKTFKQSGKREEFNAQLAQQSILTEEVWSHYFEEVNRLFDNHLNELTEIYSDLTDLDFKVIALICLKVSINDACILLNMEKNTMYTRRKTIKKRLSLESDVDLDEWIVNIVICGNIKN